jgi:homoserine dehydrogenase
MRVAIIGGGTVGGGVVEMLARHSSEFQVVYIVVRNLSKSRDFLIPSGCTVTDDIALAMSDTSVDVVVELMGGTTTAWTEVVRKALLRGTHVVTGNKALISKYLVEIEDIVHTRSVQGAFLYEAAVCGGIPVVNAFLRGMAGEEIQSVFGVMNGSTNWMLDKMLKEGSSYEELLAEASGLGYLEADPAADIQGWDARSKLCILARIAFGVFVDESKVNCVGIDVVSQIDIQYAKSQHRTIRLVAKSWKDPNTHKVHAFVMPALAPTDSAIHNLPGSGNCVAYTTKYSGTHAMLGSGAGRYPTANSVVADILEIPRNNSDAFVHPFGTVAGTGAGFDPDFDASFYVRFSEDLEGVLVRSGISANKVGDGSYVTAPCSYKRLRESLAPIVGERKITVMIVL